MKIAVSSYSFLRLVKKGVLNELEVISKAREMGFDVIEFAGLTVPERIPAEEYAEEVRETCKRVGIEMGNYTIAADFINGSCGNMEAEVERLKGEVRIAKILGAPGMRHDATWGFRSGYKGPKGFEDALPVLIKGCRAVTEYAAGLGIRTMVENHGFFCQDSIRMEKLVNGVNHENFGALVDMGNFLCADENPAEAVARMMPYAFHVHAKDFYVKPGSAFDPGKGWFSSRGGNYLRGTIIGHGEVPLAQCLRLIRKAGYDGALSIEFEGMEDVIEGITIGLENLKRLLEIIQ